MKQIQRTLALAAAALLLCASTARGNPIPGKPQNHPVALVGGTIHPVDGPDIPEGTLLFVKGKIAALGKDVKLPEDVHVIDVKGKHVYPGLIDPDTELGLVEIPSVRATRDFEEVGAINPNVKAIVSVNPESELIPVGRSGGVLTALTAPRGGAISGLSAVISLDGWTWEEMAVLPVAGLHVRWPFRGDDAKAIEDAFATARAYQAARQANGENGAAAAAFDSRWEAMLPVLKRELPVLISAEEIGQIESAVAFAVRQEVRAIIVGGYDVPLCAPLLKKHDIPVILAGVHRLPLRRDDDYDAAFTVAAKLHAAGVKFCLSSSDRGNANVRNLPHHAATAVAYGLPPEEGLKAITLSAAEILGVGDRLGSLTVGKDATLIVADGDILELSTHVEQAFIQGKPVDLSDRQKTLYEKYQEKYRRLEK
ncbi:MAG: amidohydrolase family protein [Planctomycetia bacterium]|nr:amidohydrolase family protein [Planctomycetia bacterium]